ncbi:MAG: 50S ribosomal protein L4 [Patescibacteria group bacterium]
MAKVKLYNLQGIVAGELTLSDELFGVALKPAVVHEAYIAQLANARQSLAHTKTRGDVSGGGKKPWKQKGTGRARHGSTRSPIWVGGGVTFGPRSDRDFTIKVNRKVRRSALRMILSDRLKNDCFIALEEFTLPEGKTQVLVKALQSLPGSERPTLIVVDPKNNKVRRAARNLHWVTTIAPTSLNVRDLLRHEFVMVAKADIETMTKTYGI